LLAEEGTGLGGPWSDHLEGQVWELRVRLARSSFSGKMASLDGQDPTYSACVSDQRYASEIPDAGNGTTGCWSGPGLVAGFKIYATNLGSFGGPGGYFSMTVTVWQGS
jgi:hypothetical protein